MSEGDLTAATPRPWTGGGEVIYGADGKVVLHVFGGPTRSAAERLGNAALVRAAVNGYEQRAAAPIVVVAGGEPLLHREIEQIVEGIIARKKFVYLCTNALLLEKKIDLFRPNPYFAW